MQIAKVEQTSNREALSDTSNQNAAGTIGGGDVGSTETNPAVLNDSPSAGTYTSATGMTTAQGEALGDSSDNLLLKWLSVLKRQQLQL